jgi:hypothetical protein
VPPGTSQCRRGGGIGGGTRRAQTGEPIHVTPSSKARRPCHCQRAAQMAEQRQISRHAHAVDELGTHRSAPARSASPTRGCSNLPSRRRSWATCLPGNHSRETTSGFPRAQRAGPGREGLRLLLRSRSRRRRESRQKAWCSGGAVGAGWVVVAEACWHGRARLVRWSWPC